MQDAQQLRARVGAALTGVVNPRTGTDVISSGTVSKVDIGESGEVHLVFALTADDPGTLVRDTRRALQGIEGVASVRVEVQGAPSAPQTTPKTVPPPTPKEMPNLGSVIAVSSGKGGVGKSTVSVNLASALAAKGHRVGIMDADIYGPNLPRMFGVVGTEPPIIDKKIHPLQAHGVKVMSIGSLVERDVATIWRGPIVTKIIQQFLADVAWGQLDYFIVDLPPGTGDAQLSLVQNAKVAAGIIVTTPQEVAVGDALRGAKMFEKVGVPLLGIVENMSYFEMPGGGREHVFGKGGGARLAAELGLPLLAEIPLATMVQEMGEAGTPLVLKHPGSSPAKALTALAEKVEQALAALPR
jgi:ATP-binding protein involved in chromosome partitioning